LSVLATATIGDELNDILFDVGPYADVWLDNAERRAAARRGTPVR
jgi:7,8-dihydropterin-6-yl-methyl-4-(beta-D-ribofuranosyl)aminobenzene 5'-phosphate synthase